MLKNCPYSCVIQYNMYYLYVHNVVHSFYNAFYICMCPQTMYSINFYDNNPEKDYLGKRYHVLPLECEAPRCL